jgi:hypothetical protein
MKVNLADAPAVRARLRRRQFLVNLCDMRLDRVGKIEVMDGMEDIRQRAVFMVVMGTLRVFVAAVEVRMFVFLVSMYLDGKMRRRNAALHRPFAREFDPRNAESVQCPHDRRRIGHQFQQGTREHVARRPHRTIKIKRLHSLRPFCYARKLYQSTYATRNLIRYGRKRIAGGKKDGLTTAR